MIKNGIICIQISDSHISFDNPVFYNHAKKILPALRTKYDVKNCLLLFCFTGDFAQSGKKEEYEYFKNFMSYLQDDLNNNDIKDYHFLMVPGNHDIDFNDIERTREDVNIIKAKITPQVINKELSMLKNYFNFAEIYDPAAKKQLTSTIFTYNNVKVQVNQINSSLFDTYYKNNKVEDSKGLHSIPNTAESLLKPIDDCTYTITLMHHSTEWFDYKSKTLLEKCLFHENSVIFTGHEHYQTQSSQEIDSYKNLYRISGGKFEENVASFNVFYIGENNLSEKPKFVFDEKSNVFYEEKQLAPVITNSHLTTNTLVYDEAFISSLSKDYYFTICDNKFNYFVFPQLKINEIDDSQKLIEDQDSLMSFFSTKRIIEIEGDSLSGKSTLLNYLLLQVKSTYACLLIDFSKSNSQSKEKLIKNNFEEQYKSLRKDYEIFKQLDVSKKILFIDNFDRLKHQQRRILLNDLLNDFGLILYTQSFNVNTDFQQEIIDYKNDKFLSLTIEFMYYEKRKPLISKVWKYISHDSDQNEWYNVKKVNDYISKEAPRFTLYPHSLILYIQFFYEKKDLSDSKQESFGVVFEKNLFNQIGTHFTNFAEDQVIVLLSLIAYNIHFKIGYPITSQDINKILTVDYYNDYEIRVDPTFFINAAIESKIMYKKGTDSYFFKSNSYLAYFVAKQIFQNAGDNASLGIIDYSDLEKISNEICYHINSEIILFLSYLSKDNRFLMKIADEIERFISDKDELNLDELNINYLKKVESDEAELLTEPNDSDGKEKSNNERKLKRNEILEIEQLYEVTDSDVRSFQNQTNKLRQYIRIISSSYPKMYHYLKSNDSKRIINLIYKLPNVFTYYVLKPMDEDYDGTIQMIHDDIVQKKDISIDKVKKLLNIVTYGFIVGSYYDIMSSAVNKYTYEKLINFESISLNTRLQKIIGTSILDKSENMNMIGDMFISLYDDQKYNLLIINMLRNILQIHYSTTKSIISTGKPHAVIAKLYPGTQIRKLIATKPKPDKIK